MIRAEEDVSAVIEHSVAVNKLHADMARFDLEIEVPDTKDSEMPIGQKMWTLDFIGLYAQYAAVGLVTGSVGIAYNFCVYYYEGSSNLCSNANNIVFIAWK